jgi:SAM-dependent methyltransferase
MPFYDYYNDLAPTGIGRAWAQQQAQNVLVHLRNQALQARSVVEVGPGHGAFARLCQAQHLDYLAIDINQRLLADIRQAGHNGICSLVPPFPIATATFDIAFASHVIEHSPDYRAALDLLQEMRRIIIPGGLVAIVAPDYFALGDDFWHCDYSHSFVTTRRRLRQIMRDSGLDLVAEHDVWGPLQGASGWLGGTILGGPLPTPC